MTNEQEESFGAIEKPEEQSSKLVTTTDQETLKKYGWEAPFPSYVIASKKLWGLWLQLTTRKE